MVKAAGRDGSGGSNGRGRPRVRGRGAGSDRGLATLDKKPTDFFAKPDTQVLAVIAKEVREEEYSALNTFFSKELSRVDADTGNL